MAGARGTSSCPTVKRMESSTKLSAKAMVRASEVSQLGDGARLSWLRATLVFPDGRCERGKFQVGRADGSSFLSWDM